MKKLLPILALVAISLTACGGSNPQPASPDDKNAPTSSPSGGDVAKDTDGDGIPDAQDKCPDKKEDGLAPDPKDGCPSK